MSFPLSTANKCEDCPAWCARIRRHSNSSLTIYTVYPCQCQCQCFWVCDCIFGDCVPLRVSFSLDWYFSVSLCFGQYLLMCLHKSVSQSCAVARSENSCGPLEIHSKQTAGCNKNYQSLVFVFIQLHSGQWNSLPFCLPSLIVQWPARNFTPLAISAWLWGWLVCVCFCSFVYYLTSSVLISDSRVLGCQPSNHYVIRVSCSAHLVSTYYARKGL